MRAFVTGTMVCAAIAGGIWIGHSSTAPAAAAAPVAQTAASLAPIPAPRAEIQRASAAIQANAASDADIAAATAASAAVQYVAHDAYDHGDPRADMPTKFSKETFRDFIMDKSKTDIRATIGQPDSVLELSNVVEWRYNSLPVYDADAGIKLASVGVTFSRQTDQVVSADY